MQTGSSVMCIGSKRRGYSDWPGKGNRDDISWNSISCSLQNEEVMCFDGNQMLESKIGYISLYQQHRKLLRSFFCLRPCF